MLRSKETAEHYVWGDGCDGWRLADHSRLSVIEERMPPGASEIRHYHAEAMQFFYVLRGELRIEIEGRTFVLGERQGLEIAPMRPHQVMNSGTQPAEFLVVSQPTTRGDRYEARAEGGEIV